MCPALYYYIDMIQIDASNLGNLLEVLPPTLDFVVVGEMHGSRQNAPLIQKLALAFLAYDRHVTIAFEWSISAAELHALNDYVHGGVTPTPLPSFFLNSDGRVTHEHFTLLQWIRGYNFEHSDRIDIFAFDQDSNGTDREQAMANALRAYKTQHPDSLVLVETGNMHARNALYVFDSEPHMPMAAILKETHQVFSIFLQYLAGEILVEGMPRDVTRAASQREESKPYFDALVTIPKSQAALEITSLTDVIKSI